ncbi:hypothetical protein ATANTOWER_026559 [Ataeniobius toweri]|uniref:Uncharacterized protein n=1 Tax=Ataeniobius toweri TaxID=208326 RepID=A0ABU7C3S8_9TELE|nr:hypothetical protein [Ataeniobius toweri]
MVHPGQGGQGSYHDDPENHLETPTWCLASLGGCWVVLDHPNQIPLIGGSELTEMIQGHLKATECEQKQAKKASSYVYCLDPSQFLYHPLCSFLFRKIVTVSPN